MKTDQILLASSLYNDVLDIRKKVFVLEQNIPWEMEVDEHEKDGLYFLTYSGTIPVATGRLREYGNFIKFERVATLKEYRGKGAATDLMKTMLKFALENFPGRTPFMHAQESVVSFYETLGWRKVSDKFMEADIPHFKMIYPLP